MKSKSLVFVLFMVCLNIQAQNEALNEIISYVAEELADNDPDQEAAATYTELLSELAEKPVNINSAGETELSQLFFLTDFQIRSLAEYIRSTGRIFTKYEIAAIPGFDRSLAEMLVPFISFELSPSENNDNNKFHGSFLSNYLLRNYSDESSFKGPPWKAFVRSGFSSGHISGGFSVEKDAGEIIFSGKPPLPDFSSAYLAWNGKGIVRKVIAGDFTARYGMGNGLNTGIRTGLSLTQTGYVSGSDMLKPYTSSSEEGFFRGISTELQVKKTTISVFASRNRIDAKIDTSVSGNEKYIAAFYRSGLHNSASLLESKDAVSDFCYGVNVIRDFSVIRTGIMFKGEKLSLPVKYDQSDVERIFDFSGSRNNILSVYYKAGLKNTILFGELTTDSRYKTALVQGLSFRPQSRLAINLIARIYDPGFTSFHGKGFLSSSSGDNLKGIFGNLTFELAPHLFLSAGCDLRYCPWLSYRCSAPSSTVVGEVRLKYTPVENLTIEGDYSHHDYEFDDQDEPGVTKQYLQKINSYRGTIKYSPVEILTINIRGDFKSGNAGSGKGMLLLQDLNLKFRKVPLTLWMRFCVFKTDSWETRLYTYENDLIYSFSVPALSGTGTRSYIMADYKAGKLLNIRVKYGITELIQLSGQESETKEIRIQIRMKF